jgi:hypothetical protein
MKDDGLVIGRLMNGEDGRRKAEGWWEVVQVWVGFVLWRWWGDSDSGEGEEGKEI